MRQLVGPVVSVAGEQLDFFAIYPGQYSVTVELDFVNPLSRIIGRPIHQRGELRLQGERKIGFNRVFG